MKEHSASGKHMLIMALCCLVPLAAIFMVSVLGIPLSSLGTVALVLLCPLMHILMMRGMGHHGAQGQPSCHENQSEPASTLAIDKGEQPSRLAPPAPTLTIGNTEQPSRQPTVATRT